MQRNNVRFQPGTATYATSPSSVNVMSFIWYFKKPDYCAQPEDIDAKKNCEMKMLYRLQF